MTGIENHQAVITIDGSPVALKLTLGALAEIEKEFGASSLMDLAVVLASPTASQLIALIRILAKAGGDVDADFSGNGVVNLRDALSALSSLFRDVIGARS